MYILASHASLRSAVRLPAVPRAAARGGASRARRARASSRRGRRLWLSRFGTAMARALAGACGGALASSDDRRVGTRSGVAFSPPSRPRMRLSRRPMSSGIRRPVPGDGVDEERPLEHERGRLGHLRRGRGARPGMRFGTAVAYCVVASGFFSSSEGVFSAEDASASARVSRRDRRAPYRRAPSDPSMFSELPTGPSRRRRLVVRDHDPWLDVRSWARRGFLPAEEASCRRRRPAAPPSWARA